jgi:hypothetical protein
MASTSLTRTVSSTGSLTTGTLSMWFKRTTIDAEQYLFENYETSGNRIMIRLLSSNQINLEVKQGNATKCQMNTSGMFRDPNAWYHVVFAMDSSQATASNRLKVYINGVLQTSFTDITYPSSQNQNMSFNEGNPTYVTIGRQYGASNYFDGLMSHVHWIDGTQYAASDFGETDSTTGQWKIKTSPSVTYGTNGFFILKDGNSVTDQSGQSNNLTAATGTLTNTEDCPSNVFATFNPLSSNNPTLSGGSLIATASGGYRYALSTIAPTTGKYYAEFKLTTDSGYTNFGVENISKGSFFSQYNSNSYIGEYNSGVAYQPGSSSLYHNGSSSGSYGGAVSGDIIGIAMDLDNGFIYWSKNGTFLNSGVPTSAGTGTGGYAISNIANSSGGNTYAMGVSLANTGGGRSISANFGNGYFGTTAISSEGTNASGIGKFEYDVPAGYTALSTKGLNE